MSLYLLSILVILAGLATFILAVHFGFRAPRRVERGTPADVGLGYEEISIPTRAGKRLFAWWIPARTVSTRTIILMHGWGGNTELMLPLALPLHQAGLNSLLLDARNHGRSDAASFSSMPRFAEDVGDAIDWTRLHRKMQSEKIALLGHSVGGGAVLLEASRRGDIAAVISISAFAHPEWMMRRYLSRFRLPEPLVALTLRYIEWVIGQRYDDIAPIYTACRVTCPVLLVHGRKDRTVPPADAQAIKRNCHKENLALYLIDDADHESVDKIEEHGDHLVNFLMQSGVVPKA